MLVVLLIVGLAGLVLSLAYIWGGVPGFPTWMQRRITPTERNRTPWV